MKDMQPGVKIGVVSAAGAFVAAVLSLVLTRPHPFALAGGPNPIGTGYASYISGVLQPTVVSGVPGQAAGWCDAGSGTVVNCAVAVVADAGSGGGGNKSGACSSRPTATGSGISYYCDDVSITCIDDPSTIAWKCYEQTSGSLGSGIDAGAYTVSVAGSNVLSLQQLGPTVHASVTSNANIACALTAGTLPSNGVWSVVLSERHTPVYSSYPGVGVCVSNGITNGTSALNCIGGSFSGNASWCIHQENYTLAGSRTANNVEVCNGFLLGSMSSAGTLWWRELADGVTLHYQFSMSGFDWSDWTSSSTPSGLTYFGFCMLSSGGGAYGSATIYENSSVAPFSAGPPTAVTLTNPIVVTLANSFRNGDIVALQGMTSTPTINLSTGYYLTSVSSTGFTVQGASLSGGTWSSGGVFTALNR
jgi:hypothetical protein